MTAPSTVPLAELFQLEVFLLHRVHKHGEHPHGLVVRGARGVQELKRLQKRLPVENEPSARSTFWNRGVTQNRRRERL